MYFSNFSNYELSQIQVEVCKTDVHRYCEKFSNNFPFPVEKQNCHFEQCQDEDKQYCYKVEEVVVEEVCDMKFDTSYL